jgi:hypothetical protein
MPMNKAEKMLAKKLKALYEDSSKSGERFSRDEELILERWRVLSIINLDAFCDITAGSSDHKKYLFVQGYPFTSFGDDEIKKSWYLHFRDSKGIIIIRDLFTVIAFFASLYAVISGIINK